MKILGNSILSKNFMYSNMLLTSEGLFYKLKWNDNGLIDEIFITDDHVKVIELLGLDAEEVDRLPEEEVYPLLVESGFFRVSKFFVDSSDGKSKNLKDFSEYLNKNYPEVIQKDFYRIELEELDINFPGFMDKLKYSYNVSTSVDKMREKFNQAVKEIKEIPGFDVRDLSKIIPIFNEKHPGIIDRSKYFYSRSYQEIKEEILSGLQVA